MKYIKNFTNETEAQTVMGGSDMNYPFVGFVEQTDTVLFCKDESENPYATQGPTMVDLGLSSGRLWASTNIGAEHEYDYGNYYMWGSITDNSNTSCDWAHAPFNNGSSDFNQSYFNSVKDTVCPNDTLASQYDVATQTYGNGYRMPTNAEIEELISYTNNEWVENYNNTGINGYKFTNKSDSTKSIFIPATGYRWGSYYEYTGTNVRAWTASLYTDYEGGASAIHADSYYIDSSYWEGRQIGLSVRCVK